ncbi:hypothetical protein GMORB2_0409 [Geosmithia morbida]|uniref:NDT80 domain-containing protein n=1 Tax=Geosmithia morbida TaxID=1094350 RepID=A0A9P4Z3P2_9HYPO|nr:uncharacterized protein GMORB2_0409 [Geosmithia morbida]KAF4126673.1 hypothetical protein GMORB2_0409 [Geosmithia morbida]
MDNTPRTTTTLPFPGPLPGPPIHARDQYAHGPSSFRRPQDHSSVIRSRSVTHQHRHNPLSSRSNVAPGFANSTNRMDPPFSQSAADIPPLEEIETLGSLQYSDQTRTDVEIGISGVVDKGFFLADNEWTCYRRNYFSCVCSYSLTPYIPNVPVEVTMPGSRPATVCGFAMGISAVVAENNQHMIGLVQHTPKRDKGPIKKPPKVPLMAKQDSNACQMGYFGNSAMLGQSAFPDGWVAAESGGAPQTECTFERVQFKQATQNNGKRRAAQQYYQLMIELYANTGSPSNPNHVRIAYRKSAKMIVRGRSPSHYQSDRRGSSSKPPPTGPGHTQAYGLMGPVRDFNSSHLMQPYGGYDSHGSIYGAPRHTQHTLPAETMIPPEDEKAIESTKGYQYYPGPLYQNPESRLEAWSHPSGAGPDTIHGHHSLSGLDMSDKVKDEYEAAAADNSTNDQANNTAATPATANTAINPTPPANSGPMPQVVQFSSLDVTMDHSRSCRPFVGKPTSSGYYPHHMTTPSLGVTLQ